MSISQKAMEKILSRYSDPVYMSSLSAKKLMPDGKSMDLVHITSVRDWADRLWEGNTPEALLIAALGHDFDRAFEEERDPMEMYPGEGKEPIEEWYDTHKWMHSANGARILRRELAGIVPHDMGMDITHMVLYHEVGGRTDPDGSLHYLPDRHTGSYCLNKATSTLQKADSLAFFDTLDVYVEKNPETKVFQKIKYMLGRIADPKANELVLGMEFRNAASYRLVKDVLSRH